MSHRRIITWLDATVAAVFLAVVVGGITRLTESGLSITEWKPVSGVLPPMNPADWQLAFDGYLRIPEAQTVHKGITLGQFKLLFWWEWFHRLVARGVGLVIAVPFFWFYIRRAIPRQYLGRLAALPLLVAAQGAMGWYMVSSGLSVRTDVSQYRLVAHLGLALVILVVALWTSAGLRAEADGRGAVHDDGWSRAAQIFAVWIFGVILTGGFVAGLDAGKIFNTFPLMGGRWFPEGYAKVAGFLANAFENPIAAQYHHRIVAVTTLVVSIVMYQLARRTGRPPRHVRALGRVAAVASLQVTLGIATLLTAVPVALGALHQLTAVVLLCAAVLAAHESRRDG